MGKTLNTRVAEFYLKDLLPGMPLDHHGRAIADIIPECARKNIKYLGEYLDSRFITTKQLRKVCRVNNMVIKTNPDNAQEDYYITCSDLWPDERLITS